MKTANFPRLFLSLLMMAWGSTPIQAATPTNLQIYLLMGQANMIGGDTSTLAQQIDNPQILSLNTDNQWVTAREPMLGGTGGIGPGISFAREMLQREPNATIGLVQCAVPGTLLNRWVKGGDLYQATLLRAQAAAPYGTIRGVLWHQGESDTDYYPYAQSYETRLTQMFKDLRSDLGQSNLPIVVGQLGDYLSADRYPYVDTVRAALAHIPTDLPSVGLASSTGLADLGDGVHFSAAAQQEFGPRYAHEMELLQNPTLAATTFTFALGQSIQGVALAGQDGDGDALSYAVTDGTLPDGVTLGADGSFSGTPTGQGTIVSVTVTDSHGGTATATITLQVKDFNLIVTTAADSIPGSATDTDGLTSLREAIEYANAKPGVDTVSFGLLFNAAQTISLNAPLPTLTEDVTLTGPGANLLTISAPTTPPRTVVTVGFQVTATIRGLTLSRGYGTLSNAGKVNLRDCALTESDFAFDNEGLATLTNCTLSGNNVGFGNEGYATFTNCTFANNTGVALANDNNATLTNCTISCNTKGLVNTTPLTLQNSLVVGNTIDIMGGFTDTGHNIMGGSAAATGLDPAGLKDNGGPTRTIALLSPGAAIDKGDNALVAGILTDQRGSGHSRILGAAVDIGAFEFEPDHPPTRINLSRSTVPENAGPNAGVGTLSGNDPDKGDHLTFSLPTGIDDNDLFSIILDIQLRARDSFDYATRSNYLVTIRATDTAGLFLDKQFVITVTETTKPTVSISTPALNQKLYLQNLIRISIKGTTQDNVKIQSVKVRLSRKRNNANAFWNGSDFVATQSTVSAHVVGTNWDIASQLPPITKLDAGAYQLQVAAYDAAGNKSDYANSTFTLKSDFVAPTVAITSPVAGQKVLLSNFTVSGNATDSDGVVGVKIRLSRKNGTTNVYWNGTAFTATSTLVDADVTGTKTASWKLGSAMPPVNQLSAGAYSVAVYAFDEAGNKSDTVSASFTLGTDYTTPTVSIAIPTAGQIIDINSLSSGTIAGSADDNLAVTSVKLKLQRKRGTETTYWNGSDFITTVAWVDATIVSGPGTTASWQLGQGIPAVKLDKGAYTVYAAAYDAAGNGVTSAARAFSIGGNVQAAVSLGSS